MPAESGKHRRRRTAANTFTVTSAPPTPWLVAATDLGLLGSLVLVPGCLGGRTPTGHLVLVIVAVWTALCWSLHRLSGSDTQWRWSRTEPLWLAAVALVVLQLSELPPAWLDWLSPRHAQLLGTAELRAGEEVLWSPWRRLSLGPGETASGLATLLAYGMLFLVAVQRVQDRRDAERLLQGIAVMAVGWAAFSLVHYGLGNGRFYWFIVHPQVSTTNFNTGPFITRNHFAQFLALGSGPLLWWWLKSTGGETRSQFAPATGFAARPPAIDIRPLMFAVAVTLLVLACVLTLSRGGLGALLAAMFVTLLALQRSGYVSTQFVLGLAAAGVVIGGLSWFGGGEALTKRIDGHGPELRFQIWQANIELAKAFPWFGTGVGTHESAHRLFVDLSDRGKVYSHAESSYLQVASECGLAGLALALLMTLLAVWWPVRVLTTATDRQDRAMAAALLGSLAGHLLHAAVDFLWYAPGCMVVVVLLTAIGCRVSQWSPGSDVATWTAPRLGWGLALAGILAAGGWMTLQKLPAAAAEPWTEQYRLLGHRLEEATQANDPAEAERLSRERIRAALHAVQADPRSAKWSAIGASQYLKLFDLKQERSENPMSLVQLRDAIRVSASGFDSHAAIRDWILKVTDKNQRWLDSAWQTARRAVQEDPLEGHAYLHLARLSFLKDPSGDLQQKLIERALRVRPHDPETLLAAGEEAALAGDLPQAIRYWKEAFPRGVTYQQQIAAVLAPARSPQEFLADFQPDWRACDVIAQAYAAVGRIEEQRHMQYALADAAVAEARQLQDSSSVTAWIAACSVYRDFGELGRSEAVLREAMKRNPNQYEIRRALGGILMMQSRYAEAAEHLRWASARRPNDAGLRQTAELAVRESHRVAGPPLVTPASLQRLAEERSPEEAPAGAAAWPVR